MKLELRYGVLMGTGYLAWLCIEYGLGFHREGIPYLPIMEILYLVPIGFIIYLAQREKRKTLDGKITTKEAFITGLFSTLIGAIITPLSLGFFIAIINPKFLQAQADFYIRIGSATPQNVTEIVSLRAMILNNVGLYFFAGTFMSGISALMLKKKIAVSVNQRAGLKSSKSNNKKK